jgi:hypothetical protein
MGQNCIQLGSTYSPHRGTLGKRVKDDVAGDDELLHHHPLLVAVQVVEFESKGLKPGFHLIGSRVESRRLSGYGSTAFNLHSPTFLAPSSWAMSDRIRNRA